MYWENTQKLVDAILQPQKPSAAASVVDYKEATTTVATRRTVNILQNQVARESDSQPVAAAAARAPQQAFNPQAFVNSINIQHELHIQQARAIDFDADTVYAKYVGNDLSISNLNEKVDIYWKFLNEKAAKLGNTKLSWTSEESWAAYGRYIGQHHKVVLKFTDVYQEVKSMITDKDKDKWEMCITICAKINECGAMNRNVYQQWEVCGLEHPDWKDTAGQVRHLLERSGAISF